MDPGVVFVVPGVRVCSVGVGLIVDRGQDGSRGGACSGQGSEFVA